MSSSTRVLPVLFLSRKLRIRSLLLAITLATCVPSGGGASHSQSVTPDGAASVDQAVRVFMQTVFAAKISTRAGRRYVDIVRIEHTCSFWLVIVRGVDCLKG